MSDKRHTAYDLGFSGMKHRRKAELCRLLEVANINLASSRELIGQIFEPDSAKQIENRVYRLQEQIGEIKRLVKQ